MLLYVVLDEDGNEGYIVACGAAHAEEHAEDLGLGLTGKTDDAPEEDSCLLCQLAERAREMEQP